MSINPEKQSIIALDGNVLVTANPGTGKTKLLAYKYVDLISRRHIAPEKILCLTFTHKARNKMEEDIIKALKSENVSIDISKLNVFTFHSYALDNIEDNEVLSTNLLRYAILRYLKDNQILNYSDSYLIDTIVPKLENLMRYLKSFGILPEDINIKAVKNLLEEGENYTKEEIDRFADYFLAIFHYYETLKSKHGVDYADLLIKFMKLKNKLKFDYVLVDELQDVNVTEAEIALKSANNFFVVGDKKQAIFGFQGGSILNFEKFADSKQKILSENFRSSNEVLAYAREHFIRNTREESHKKDLKDLRNAENKTGPKPVVYSVDRKNIFPAACDLLKGLKGKTAIITRTNYQIADIAKELKARNVDFSSTFFSASDDAKTHIINFLKGVLSPEIQDVRNAMFTPFFPCSLQEAFKVTNIEKLTFEQVFRAIPAFKDLREYVKSVEDVNKLFKERILPVCVSYGKEYLSAGIAMQTAYQEAVAALDDKSMNSMVSYMQTTDLLSQDSDVEKELVLTTVHKAKGKEFDNVIYIPSKPQNRRDFQDKVVEAILCSKGVDIAEELEEETLRVNFVAFTRAQDRLMILTDKPQDYLNDYAEEGHIDGCERACVDFNLSRQRAFDLFVNGRFEDAKKLLESKEQWIKDYVKDYFLSLEHVSFSSLPDKAYNYFVSKILGIKETSFALSLGSDVHKLAQEIAEGREVAADERLKPYTDNVKTLLAEIRKKYPEIVKAEQGINVPLSQLGFDSKLRFTGYMDAVFRNGNDYLIVDWKTDKDTSKDSLHRQQLEAYRRAFALREGIPAERIKVAIAFIGLRSTINTGRIDCELDEKQPGKTAFETMSKRVNKLLSWIRDPEQFFQEFLQNENAAADELLWKSVVEEWGRL